MTNNKDREQFEEFMDIFTRLYSNTMKELAVYERKEKATDEQNEDENRSEIRNVMNNITDLYKEAVSELIISKTVKTEEKPVKRPKIPRNPNRRPTKVNTDLSMARLKEKNRKAIEDIFGRY